MAEPRSPDQILTDLLEILEAEHTSLTAGQAGTAGGLLQAKMAAMQAFDALMEEPERVRGVPDYQRRMQRIITLASENAALFSAVRNGLNSAIGRVGSAGPASYVGAYTATGDKTAFTKAVGGYAKKI